jgi:N,N'-diacetyllegionaminate synthase
LKILIIAEAGVNHNGDMSIAKKLIDIAAESGADLVKFQTFRANSVVTKSALKADYQLKHSNSSESHHEMLSRLQLTEEMHQELIKHCGIRKIGFFSTGFDIESIDLLISLGQDQFKIPSGEITNLPLLRHIGQLGKKVILSTGMSDLMEVRDAIEVIVKSGTPKEKITVLHCTSEYPAPMVDVNLRAMISIRDLLDVSIGYSDHTKGIEIAIAAAAMGAAIIEKHFTLDRNLDGPDHQASLDPSELKAMITAIRNIEVAMGDGVKKIAPSELGNRIVARKSIVAKVKINKGDQFTSENLTSKRPGTGISPMLWDVIIGTKSRKNYLADEIIEL